MDKAITEENQKTQMKGEGGKNIFKKQMWGLQWIKWFKKQLKNKFKYNLL